MADAKLQIIPLGGLGEFGMNCLALRYKDDIIVIDAGLMFPESELLGVDIVVPDITYLVENKQHVRAIILTHGHEDHIGGLPWILSELNVPVYGTEFTLAYVDGKLEEHALDDAELIEIVPGERFTLGAFTVEPIRVTHSLVDCVALAIETPVGVVVHTGDFKIDLSPPDGKAFDLHRFAEYGKRGVLALLQDSTNVDRPGYTPSEWAVKPRLDEIFSAPRRSSSSAASPHPSTAFVSPCELARHHSRKVAIVGRSIANPLRSLRTSATSTCLPGLIIHPGQIRDYSRRADHGPHHRHPGRAHVRALSRAAVNNHKYARIDAGDTVVLSSRVIPGNEKSIYRMIDHLERRDADVIYDDGTQGLIHVSGHGCQEELRLMINLLRPKFFVPVHGDYRHLKRHAELAQRLGIVDHAILLEDGEVLDLDQRQRAAKPVKSQPDASASTPAVHRCRRRHRYPRSPASFRRRHRAAHSSPLTSSPAT